MPNYTYTYNVLNDFPPGSENGAVNPQKLNDEIQTSSIVIALDNIKTYYDSAVLKCDIVFKDELSTADKTTLDGDTTNPCGGLIAAHDNTPSPILSDVNINNVNMDAEGKAVIAIDKPAGEEAVFVTHNFCDETTWYDESTRVTDEVATDDGGDHTIWSVANGNIIDMTHGNIHDEDNIKKREIHEYAVGVKVNDVLKTTRPPFATDWSQGGDYYVNYILGQIIFKDNQEGNTVKVGYSYAVGARWRLVPESGKKIIIERAEVQFSKDLEYNDTLVYEVKAKVNEEPPVYVDAVPPVYYKKVAQVIAEAYGTFPTILPCGGSARGIEQDYYNYPFIYTRRKEITSISSQYPLEFWLELENDKVYGGEHCSISFYCSIAVDNGI